MFVAACMAIVFRYGVRLAIKHAGEVNRAMIGVTCGIVAFTGYAFTTAGWQMFVFIAIFAPMGLIMPALITSMLSKEVGPSGQGELERVVQRWRTDSCCRSAADNACFPRDSRPRMHRYYFPGAAFVLGAGIGGHVDFVSAASEANSG